MNFELRQLHQFVTIAEAGSYRRAAELLHIAQPALSVSIQKLEHSMGALLFTRSVKGVLLTEAGEVLFDKARKTLLSAAHAQRAVQQAVNGESGALRLGFVGSATYALLPAVIPRYRREHPEIDLTLLEGSTVGLMAALRKDELDAAFVRGPIVQDGEFDSVVAERDDFVLALHASHPMARRRSVSLPQFADQAFILYSPEQVPGLNSVVLSLCSKAGFAPIVQQEAVQVQTVVSLVASGLGVALVPAVARHYSTPHVQFVAIRETYAKSVVSLSLVTHRSAMYPPVQWLLQCLRKQILQPA